MESLLSKDANEESTKQQLIGSMYTLLLHSKQAEFEKRVDDPLKLFNLDYLVSVFSSEYGEFISSVNCDLLCSYSILPPKCSLSEKLSGILKNSEEPSEFSLTIEENRSIASMVGMAIGDSLGHLLEFQQLDYERNYITDFNEEYFDLPAEEPIINRFQLKHGQWTDDTSMALCVADSLLELQPADIIDFKKRWILWWFFGYNNAFRFDTQKIKKTSIGLGSTIEESFSEFLQDPSKKFTKKGTNYSCGIGSLVRVAPIAIYYHLNIDTALTISSEQSLATHKGLEAADACKLLSFLIIEALHYPKVFSGNENNFAKEFLDVILNDFKKMQFITKQFKSKGVRCIALSAQECDFYFDHYAYTQEDRNWNWRNPSFEYSPRRVQLGKSFIGSYALDGLAMSLHCLYHTNSFPDALLKAINLGGDADSVGATVGQLGGAIYGLKGIPSKWIHGILKWDSDCEIATKTYLLLNKEKIEEIIHKKIAEEEKTKNQKE